MEQSHPRHASESAERQQLDAQAQAWIELAQRRAQQRDFQGAIIALEQIPVGSSYYQNLQPKLQEYRQQREIRATWLLQQAYDQAALGQFSEAIAYLQQIPQGTPAYSTARLKLDEYRLKAQGGASPVSYRG